jgi:hypothetical protein
MRHDNVSHPATGVGLSDLMGLNGWLVGLVKH